MTCPFCNFEKVISIGPVNTSHNAYSRETTLVKCTRCGMFYNSPLPDEEELAKIYAGTYHYTPNAMMDRAIQLWTSTELAFDTHVIQSFAYKGRILDIGAGRGDMLVRFSVDQWERWGYDPFLSDGDISQLKTKIGDHVNDFKSLEEYPEGYFDVVILRNVIEHTAQFENLLQKINRILSSNGYLFIRTPNISSQDFKNFKNEWYVIEMAGHIVFFDETTLSNALERNGFTVPYITPAKYSAPTSHLRSSKSGEFIGMKITRSLLFALKPFFNRDGGDLIAMGKKR